MLTTVDALDMSIGHWQLSGPITGAVQGQREQPRHFSFLRKHLMYDLLCCTCQTCSL